MDNSKWFADIGMLDRVEGVDLGKHVGEYVRKWRTRNGITRDRLASAASLLGADWGVTSISNLEDGRMAMSVPNLVVLLFAMNMLSTVSITMEDLVPATLDVSITDSLDVQNLTDLLGGGNVLTRIEADVHVGDRPIYSLAETRAAARLGVSVEDLVTAARELWGMSLDQHSAQVAGDNATPQGRGHATRKLLKELRAHFNAKGE